MSTPNELRNEPLPHEKPEDRTPLPPDEIRLETTKARVRVILKEHLQSGALDENAVRILHEKYPGMTLHSVKHVMAHIWAHELDERARRNYGNEYSKAKHDVHLNDGKVLAKQFVEAESAALLHDVGNGIYGSAQNRLDLLRDLELTYPVKIKQCQLLLQAVGELQKLEFLNSVATAPEQVIKLHLDTGGLEGFIQKLLKDLRAVQAHIKRHEDALKQTDAAKKKESVEKATERYDADSDKIFLHLEAVSIGLEESIHHWTAEIYDDALSAYVRNTSPAVNNIKAVRSASNGIIGLLGSLLKTTNLTGIFVRLADACSFAATIAAKEGLIKNGMTKWQEKHSRSEALEMHTKDPLLVAKALVDQQSDALQMLTKTLTTTISAALIPFPGASDLVLAAADAISSTTTTVIQKFLEERVDLARSAIKAAKEAETGEAYVELAPEAGWKKAQDIFEKAYAPIQKGIEDAITSLFKNDEKIKTGLKSLAGGITDFLTDTSTPGTVIGMSYTPGSVDGTSQAGTSFNPAGLTSAVLGLIIPPVWDVVLKVFPPSPAQTFTGDQLSSIMSGIKMTQLPLHSVIEKAPPPAPVKAFDVLPADLPDSFDSGAKKFQWKETNRDSTWQVDGKPFAYATSIDFDGAEVWGSYYVKYKQWAPERIAPSQLADISEYVPYDDGMGKYGEPRIKGTWAFVEVKLGFQPPGRQAQGGYTYCTFQPADGGKRMWLSPAAPVKYSATREDTLRTFLTDIQAPTYDLWTLMNK